jgi:hypothetical protein
MGAALPGGPIGSPATIAVPPSARKASTPPWAKWNALSARSANGAIESSPWAPTSRAASVCSPAS